MNKLEKFKQTIPAAGRRSKLEPHREAIEDLISNGYSNHQILDYLQTMEQLSVSYATLSRFIQTISRDLSLEESSNQKPMLKIQTKRNLKF